MWHIRLRAASKMWYLDEDVSGFGAPEIALSRNRYAGCCREPELPPGVISSEGRSVPTVSSNSQREGGPGPNPSLSESFIAYAGI